MLQRLETALTDLLAERGGRLSASIRGEFQKLHHRRENWRREAEEERRHKVSLLLERERGYGPASEEAPRAAPDDAAPGFSDGAYAPVTQRPGRNGHDPVRAESAASRRAVTEPLSRFDIPDESVGEFTGGSDLISVIEYTWKLARGQL